MADAQSGKQPPISEGSEVGTDLSPAVSAAIPLHVCDLAWPQQKRNLVLFAACTGVQYLAAPMLYVGITQASLCEKLGANARTSNLPATLYFAMTASPALIAWLSPGIAVLKRNLVLCYLITAAILGSLALVLSLPVSNAVKLGMVILQGAVSGAVMPAAVAFLWEAIGRGSDESRRGLALSLAFGFGPLLAVAGSMCQVALLGGELFGWTFTGIEYPWGFVALFGAGAPIMLLAAFLASGFVVTKPDQDLSRAPASSVVGLLLGIPSMFASLAAFELATLESAPLVAANVWNGAGYACLVLAAAALIYHFRSILTQRVLLIATVVTILAYSGNTIPSNMNLYTQSVLDASPASYAGLQNTLRFGFKMAAGLVLGWMLTKTNPRAGIVATTLVFIAAQLWAMFASGTAYLVAFGLYGAGELVGVYAPNYILSASRSSEMRRNMAFVTMLMVPAAPTGYLYGAIADSVRKSGLTMFGITDSTALGFQMSFAVCAAMMLAGVIIAMLFLPKRPGVSAEQKEMGKRRG